MGVRKYGNIFDIPMFLADYQPKWHIKVDKMWHNMWRRVYTDFNYFGCQIHPSFKYLSNFVTWLESQPRFEEFCSTCDDVMWCIDKDMVNPGNRNYYPDFMSLTTVSENSKERIARKGTSLVNTPIPIMGISLDNNTILLFKSRNEVRSKGFDQSAVGKACKGKFSKAGHIYKKYSWYYLDMNDRGGS